MVSNKTIWCLKKIIYRDVVCSANWLKAWIAVAICIALDFEICQFVDTFDNRLVHSHSAELSLRTKEEESESKEKGSEVGAHVDLQSTRATHFEVSVNYWSCNI